MRKTLKAINEWLKTNWEDLANKSMWGMLIIVMFALVVGWLFQGYYLFFN